MPDASEAIVIRLERLDGVGIIQIDNPPINAGCQAVRAGLLEAIRQVDADDGLSGAILIGAGAMFPACIGGRRHRRACAGGDGQQGGFRDLRRDRKCAVRY